MVIEVIVLEDSVYIGRYCDRFSGLLDQLNIEDTKENREIKIVRCWFEISNSDIFSSINQISEASIEVVQYELPPWFTEDDALTRTKDAFKKWYKEHVLIDQEINKLSSGFYCLKNCKVECLSADVDIEKCQDCQIDLMMDEAIIRRCQNIQVNKMFDESRIRFGYKDSIVNSAYENCQINRYVKIIYDYRNKKEL